MLQICVGSDEQWDEIRGEFRYGKVQTLTLEHSLVSISKWEAKWGKAFLGKQDKTSEELTDYVRCMTLTQNVAPEVYQSLSAENFEEIRRYIDAPMTATKFFGGGNEKGANKDTITSELIYYWMITLNIPFECQKWHLNRLLTLVRICDIKNRPPKKMSRKEVMSRNRALNEARKKKNHTRG